MLTMYHAPKSRSSRILWLLEELGADYDIVYTDISRMDGSGVGACTPESHGRNNTPLLPGGTDATTSSKAAKASSEE